MEETTEKELRDLILKMKVAIAGNEHLVAYKYSVEVCELLRRLAYDGEQA